MKEGDVACWCTAQASRRNRAPRLVGLGTGIDLLGG